MQQRLVKLRKDGRIDDVLLLLEHTPVITLGRNAKAANVLASPDQLAFRGVEVYECDRGGDVTFHGPGQLVGYPILDLGTKPDVMDHLRKLEEVVIRAAGDVGVELARDPEHTGVWAGEERSG